MNILGNIGEDHLVIATTSALLKTDEEAYPGAVDEFDVLEVEHNGGGGKECGFHFLADAVNFLEIEAGRELQHLKGC
jgi:hypothetical protein